jgi:hypothetical protein
VLLSEVSKTSENTPSSVRFTLQNIKLTIATMPDNTEDRASLVNRQLPEMVLSTADNPLTAPRPPPDNLSTAQKAAYRFQVTGNAIST